MSNQRLKVWSLRSKIRLQTLLVSWFGSAPYYTKFPPNRSFTIKSSSSFRKIKINVFEPPDFDPSPGKKYPVYINFHGSVFIIPSLGTDADFCRIVSNRTGAIVLDCDYAKAPEWPFPAAPEDVKNAITYVLANKEGYFDISRIAIGGFSVGGTLALTAGASQPKGVLKGVVAMYPATDLSIDHRTQTPPHLSDGNSNTLPPWLIHLGYASYINFNTDLSDPRLSPMNTDIPSFPERILLVVCEEDPLRDEALGLAEKLKTAGIKLDLKELPKMVHAWDKEAKERTLAGAARHEAYEAAVDMLVMTFGE
ncbi:Alpha/Beta hydrolase protein [Rhizoctonia solani]|nr:Alpha/Beta hydrolase protein [Rhizoctonia solani]